MIHKLTTIVCTLLTSSALASEPTLDQLIKLAYEQNPLIKSYEQQIKSISQAAIASSVPQSPQFGISELNRGNTTRYWSFSQKFELPAKYDLRDDIEAQNQIAKEKQLANLKLQIRSKVITLYYALFSVNKIITLTRADLQKVKEISRIAESKYAAGKAAMHDTMKAHVLQTQIETDLISLNQEQNALQARLRNHLNQPEGFRINAFPASIILPTVNTQKDLGSKDSFVVAQKQAEYHSAKLRTQLANWDFAPDLTFRYQQRLSGTPENSRSVALEMSVPLWFWGKTASQRQAGYNEAAKKFELEAAAQQTSTKTNELHSKVKSQQELLAIMDTALIPQAQTSYSATLDAYKANKSSFLELLDSERSLLKVQIAYYRLMTTYVENITELETTLGKPVTQLAI